MDFDRLMEEFIRTIFAIDRFHERLSANEKEQLVMRLHLSTGRGGIGIQGLNATRSAAYVGSLALCLHRATADTTLGG